MRISIPASGSAAVSRAVALAVAMLAIPGGPLFAADSGVPPVIDFSKRKRDPAHRESPDSNPPQVEPSVCAEFRTAIAIHEAAASAAKAYLDANPFDVGDKSPMGIERRARQFSMVRAASAAARSKFSAAGAVRESIDDEATADAIDAIVAADLAIEKAGESLDAWHNKHIFRFGAFDAFIAVAEHRIEVERSATDLYLEALKAACRLGLVGIRE